MTASPASRVASRNTACVSFSFPPKNIPGPQIIVRSCFDAFGVSSTPGIEHKEVIARELCCPSPVLPDEPGLMVELAVFAEDKIFGIVLLASDVCSSIFNSILAPKECMLIFCRHLASDGIFDTMNQAWVAELELLQLTCHLETRSRGAAPRGRGATPRGCRI